MYARCKADTRVTLSDEDPACEEGMQRRGKVIQARPWDEACVRGMAA